MKTSNLMLILWICALLLTACGGASTSTNSFRSGTGSSRALTPEAKLALGTLKLEGTPQAVDPALAAKLLPLWQLLAQLNSSSSAAPQEVAAVLDQINATMTADQIKAISSMQLTSADMFAVLQEQGQANRSAGTSSAGGSRSSSSSSSSNRRSQGGESFVFIGGGPPGGGFAGGAVSNGAASNSTQSQNRSGQSSESFAKATSLILVNQLIRLLESRAKT